MRTMDSTVAGVGWQVLAGQEATFSNGRVKMYLVSIKGTTCYSPGGKPTLSQTVAPTCMRLAANICTARVAYFEAIAGYWQGCKQRWSLSFARQVTLARFAERGASNN